MGELLQVYRGAIAEHVHAVCRWGSMIGIITEASKPMEAIT